MIPCSSGWSIVPRRPASSWWVRCRRMVCATPFPPNIASVIAVDALESGHTSPGVVRAPGRDMVSLAPHAHYDFYSGSSLATAEISGLIALLRAQRPHLTAQDARYALLQSEANDAPASPPNACAALASLMHDKSVRRPKTERPISKSICALSAKPRDWFCVSL